MYTPTRMFLVLIFLANFAGCSSMRHTYNRMFGKEVSQDSCGDIGCGLDGTCAAPGVMEGHSCECQHCQHSPGYTEAIQKYRTQKHVGHRGKVSDCPHMKYRRKLGRQNIKRPRGVNRSMKYTYGSEIYDLPYPELAGGELFPGDDGMMEDYCPICNVSYCPDCLGIEDDYYYQGGVHQGGYVDDGMMYGNGMPMEMMDGGMNGQMMDNGMNGQMMYEGDMSNGYMPGMEYQQNGNIYLPQPGEVYTPGQQGQQQVPDDGSWRTSPEGAPNQGMMNTVPNSNFPQNPNESQMKPSIPRMNPMTPGLPPSNLSPQQPAPNHTPAPMTTPVESTTTWRSGATFPGTMQATMPASFSVNSPMLNPPELLMQQQ